MNLIIFSILVCDFKILLYWHVWHHIIALDNVFWGAFWKKVCFFQDFEAFIKNIFNKNSQKKKIIYM